MKKVLLAVGALVAMVFAAACSSGGGGGAHGTFSSGTYDVTNAAFTKDSCNLAALIGSAGTFDGSVAVTVTGGTMEYNGDTLTGGGAVYSTTTNDTFALPGGTCNVTENFGEKVAANGTDKGTWSIDIKISQAAGSTDCSGQIFPVPCESAVNADIAKTGP